MILETALVLGEVCEADEKGVGTVTSMSSFRGCNSLHWKRRR